MKLDPRLLSSSHEGAAPTFAATLNAHGLYHNQQFVLRLSPVNHRLLANAPSGIYSSGEIGFERAQAMSTYLHETVHWWQHIGSTYGLLLSLNYPVQTHANYSGLLALLNNRGFKKSIRTLSMSLNQQGPTGPGTDAGRTNAIINNHFDLLAFRAFTMSPRNARNVVEQNLFEAVGHALHMTYANTIGVLADTVDRKYSVLPDPRLWSDGFRKLRDERVEGYYFGSPVGLWPIGSLEIFEGQARFSQLQFLSFASGHGLGWNEFHSTGMLNGIYVKAFEEFLHLTRNEWPHSVNHPLVALFLLVCDLALNPARGFPITVDPDYRAFIHDVNPGARFCIFCQLIARDLPEAACCITQYSREEYCMVAKDLCDQAREASPVLVAELFAKWFSKDGALAELRHEYESYDFKETNFVVRHVFAHFLAFQEDKFQHPEIFCWPGAHMAGQSLTERSMDLFERHSALFVDWENDNGVFPRLQKSRDQAAVQRAFESFYANSVNYDLVNQWIAKEGPFQFDLGWLAANAEDEETRSYMRRHFKTAFGVDPEDVEILE